MVQLPSRWESGGVAGRRSWRRGAAQRVCVEETPASMGSEMSYHMCVCFYLSLDHEHEEF